jgi:DNA-binding CsgD family transcriptional regulator
MVTAESLQRGREALHRQAWGEGYQRLAAADRQAPLAPADLEELAVAAHLLGKGAECAELMARAHQGYLREGDLARAARCAVWLAFRAYVAGEQAQGGGWAGRAARLLEAAGGEGPERGYLSLLSGMRAFRAGETLQSQARFDEALGLGQRFRDADLVALALQGQGRALIHRGEAERGAALLDEAMVGVQAGEVSPAVVGNVYCSVLEACGETFDLRRADEWTGALERWCAAHPEVVPFRGPCMVHRAELLLQRGAWPEALAEARRVRGQPGAGPGAAAAASLEAEVHRRRGALRDAEQAYRLASQWGQAPGPGLALLRLAQGQAEAARSVSRRAVERERQPGHRAVALAACVEISLAAGDTASARGGAEELVTLTARLDVPYLRGLRDRAAGAVALAEGDPAAAADRLWQALATWRELEVPYEVARTRVLVASACRGEEDDDTAVLELQEARRAFGELGAAPELARVEALLAPARAGALTARETQVLVLVASGRTNRDIAAELAISEKTVARHLSNIFGKLDLPSRAAATAYAFRNDLV